MTLGLSRISISEFTRRIIERTGLGNWFLLIAPEGDVLEVAERVAFGLASETSEGEVKVDRPLSADEVVDLARRKETLVVADIDTWPASEWARWDVLRGRLLPSHKVALVVSRGTATRLFIDAPHFIRLFSGSVWEVEPEEDPLSEVDRQRLLASLEDWGKMSTAEMIRRAECKELLADPEYVDWLVLAGRSDLL